MGVGALAEHRNVGVEGRQTFFIHDHTSVRRALLRLTHDHAVRLILHGIDVGIGPACRRQLIRRNVGMQRKHLVVVGGIGEGRLPLERLDFQRNARHGQFDAAVADLTGVDQRPRKARTRRDRQAHDLILGRLLVERQVETQPALEETDVETYLHRVAGRGFQVIIGNHGAGDLAQRLSVEFEPLRSEIEIKLIRVRIAADIGPRRTQFAEREPVAVLEKARKDQAARNRRIPVGAVLRAERRRNVVADRGVEIGQPLVTETYGTEHRTHLLLIETVRRIDPLEGIDVVHTRHHLFEPLGGELFVFVPPEARADESVDVEIAVFLRKGQRRFEVRLRDVHDTFVDGALDLPRRRNGRESRSPEIVGIQSAAPRQFQPRGDVPRNTRIAHQPRTARLVAHLVDDPIGIEAVVAAVPLVVVAVRVLVGVGQPVLIEVRGDADQRVADVAGIVGQRRTVLHVFVDIRRRSIGRDRLAQFRRTAHGDVRAVELRLGNDVLVAHVGYGEAE